MPSAADLARIPGYARNIIDRMSSEMQREPWLRIDAADRVDHLPDLIIWLLRDALAQREQREVPEGVRQAAGIHGRQRRAQQFPEEVLFDEYSLLRNQTLRMLWTTHAQREAERIISRVDRSITEATVASLRAYHEAE